MNKMDKVKIACTSDTHGNFQKVVTHCFGRGVKESPSVIVIAGDIAPADFGVSESDYIRRTFFGIVRRHPETEFVYTPGNHDFFAQQWDRFSGDAPKNFHFLLDEGCEICGLRFYGTPWVPYINGLWAFECMGEDELGSMFGNIPHGLDVLVTHTPPRIGDERIDVSMQLRGWDRHFGSTALLDAIRAKRPWYLVCGHIHSGDHGCIDVRHEDGSVTHCFNVSHVDERYRPKWNPATIYV